MRLSKIPEASLKMIHAFKKGLACDNTNKTLCSYMLKNTSGDFSRGLLFLPRGHFDFHIPTIRYISRIPKKSVFLRI